MDKPKMQISRIEYRYNDSSVPPPYHRSYDIVVLPDSISIKVDSYGEVLTDTAFSLLKADFQHICDTLSSFNFQSRERKEPHGCVGGTGEELNVYDIDGNSVINGSVYYCGGEEYGTLLGDLKGFGNILRSKIPDFRTHLKD